MPCSFPHSAPLLFWVVNKPSLVGLGFYGIFALNVSSSPRPITASLGFFGVVISLFLLFHTPFLAPLPLVNVLRLDDWPMYTL